MSAYCQHQEKIIIRATRGIAGTCAYYLHLLGSVVNLGSQVMRVIKLCRHTKLLHANTGQNRLKR